MNVFHDSKVRDLINKAIEQGFILEPRCGSGNYRLLPKDKKYKKISFSSTPSDCNFYWQLRRMLRKSGYCE